MHRPQLPFHLIIFGLITLYSIAHLAWYLQTPLGLSPVLDGQENLLLARKIADGTLEPEPFFRAMLYPAVIAFFPLGHSLLGLLCHIANAFLCKSLAQAFWKNKTAGLIAAGLVGFNPVLIHFAFDPLDTTLSITFFLASLAALQKSIAKPAFEIQGVLLASVSGLAISLAALTRPNFFLTLATLVGLLAFASFKKRISLSRLCAYLTGIALPLLAMGFAQQSVSGSFRIMPWQGAYNLWVSNNPAANGLYYRQSLSFHTLEQHQNPARMEDTYLYQQEHGHAGSISERNAYWRSRTLDSISESPLQWLKLEAFKLYASLNNFEQYNNKTYSFHKRLSPYLKFNPIGWGLIFALATFSAATLWLQIRGPITPLLLTMASILAGLLLFMASARFRMPLVPLLAIVAAGLPLAIPAYRASSWKIRRHGLIAASLALAIAFSQFAGVASTETYTQDELLIADAAARIGEDQKAIEWSGRVLEKDPAQQQALRIHLLSRYNQLASGELAPTPLLWQELQGEAMDLGVQDELLSFVRGVILWNIGSTKAAIDQWKNGYATYELRATSCLAALMRVGSPIQGIAFPVAPDVFIREGRHWIYGYEIARSLPSKESEAFLQSIDLSPAAYDSIGLSLQRIIPIKQ